MSLLPGPAASYGTVVPPSGLVLVVLVMLMAGGAVGFLVALLFRAVAAMARKTQGEDDDRLVRKIAPPSSVLLGLVAAGAALAVFGRRADPALLPYVANAFFAAFVIVGAWLVVRVARLALEATGRRQARLLPATRVSGRIVAVIVFTWAFLMVMQQYGISITPLLTGLGIAGLAAALALQDTLSNFFAGLSIQTGQAMQPGHFVRLENEKLEGYVEQVGWRTTNIRTLAGNTISIPNSKLANAVVTDYYLPSKELSVSVEFLVGLESDQKKVAHLLMEEAREVQHANPEWFAKGEPFAQLNRVTDYALEFTVSLRVTEFVQQFAARRATIERVFERFRREGIRIPYPTQHHFHEAVKPDATRVPGAPGGLAPKGARTRPKPVARAKHPPLPQDPRLAEAHKAKADIAAKQAEIKAKAEDGDAKEDAKAAKEDANDAEEDAKKAEEEEAREAQDAAAEHATDGKARGEESPVEVDPSSD